MIIGTAQYSRSALALTPAMMQVVKDFHAAGLKMPATRSMLLSQFKERPFFNGKTISNAFAKLDRDNSDSKCNEAMEFVKALNGHKEEDPEWFVAVDIDRDTNQLDKVFWMNPDQKRLYKRYHDVVINDTTAQTNRFMMGLNVTVVIDNHGASRVVALALTRTGRGTDYSWVLGQLLVASGGQAPGVFLVDEDKAMEVACSIVFPDTPIINCVWHVANNFAKYMGTRMASEDSSNDHSSRFWLVRDVTTVQEFDDEWSKLVDQYGSGSKIVKKHLNDLYDRRFHWARPWTGTCFTAGAESTQRVEKSHHLIKLLLRKNTSLKGLLDAIERKFETEVQTSEHLDYKSNLKAMSADVTEAFKYFPDIIEENSRYLGRFGQFQMKKEMAFSFYYECHVQEVRTFIGAQILRLHMKEMKRLMNRMWSLDGYHTGYDGY
jgi:hypothetical protein